MTISDDKNSLGPTDGEATASGDTATELLGGEEIEPLLQMLFRQQEESMRLQEERSTRMQEESMRIQEERYLQLRQEMEERMNGFLGGSEQQSRGIGNTSLSSSGRTSSFNFQSELSTLPEVPESIAPAGALDSKETFYDDVGEEGASFVHHGMGTAIGDTSKHPNQAEKTVERPEIKSWMYDLGGKIQNDDYRNTSIFNSKKKIRQIKNKGGLAVSFASNDDEQLKALSQITSQQQNRRNFVSIVEKEFIVLKDHKKQQDERIRSQDERIQSQDDMIQLLETKIQQIENQGNNANRTSMIPGRYSIFRTFTELSSPSEDSDYFSHDTFTMMVLNKFASKSWMLGTTSFGFQMVLGSMIAIKQFDASVGSSIFNVPFKVDTEVRVVQFLSIILCLSIQSDILTSVKSFVLLGRGSNWRQVIGVDELNSDIVSCGLWTLRVGVPNTMKLVQGLTVTFVSFVIIIQAYGIIDLLKDFTALMIISETDNILYQLAIHGYLGEQLRQEAVQIEQKIESASLLDANDRRQGKGDGLVYVRIVFLLLLGGMFGGWGIIFQNQTNGVYFQDKFPGCVSYELALEHFGDGVCYGGTLNTIECKFEDGDCINHNTAFPNCKGKGLEGLVNIEKELSKDICNLDFAIPECDYHGGICCPYELYTSPLFRDGQCHSGIMSRYGCDLDGSCLEFIGSYPDCDTESGANGTIFGNGICEGGGYTTEECGYEDGDCDVGQSGGDMIFTGIYSPDDGRIYYDTKMSSDGSMVLIEMLHTRQSGEFDKNAPGRVLGYRYDQEDKRWVKQPILKGHKTFDTPQDNNVLPFSWAVNGDGNLVAFGLPRYNDYTGQVDFFDFFGTTGSSTPPDTIFGNEEMSELGHQVDMTDDGSRIAVSSTSMVQVFQYDESEQVWAQVGDSIIGTTSDGQIGVYNLRINSLDGTRVFFDAFEPEEDLSGIRAYELNLNSNEWVQLGDDISSSTDGNTIALDLFANKLVVSADGSRIAQSLYSMTTTRPGKVHVFDLITDPVSNERKWSQLGPTIFGMYSDGEYNGNAGDGFGRDISMSADGILLVVTSVKPSCDGVNIMEAYFLQLVQGYYSDFDGFPPTNSDLCATGSVQMYQFKYTNPPYRPFTLLPYKRESNSQNILEEAEQERDDGTILGLQVSLSEDGLKFAVSGLDLTTKNGFVKVYNVADLFYIDCLVDDPESVGNGDCRYNFRYDLYYTEECGYGGGNCPLPSPVDGFDDCKVDDPSEIGNGWCYPYLPYNSEQCGYDGGDCPLPVPVDGYPNCAVLHPQEIGNGECHFFLPYDSYDCGFDGGDCLPPEYMPTSSPSKSSSSSSNYPSTSTMPTTDNIVIYLELHTDSCPEETTWSLTNESDDGIVVAMGPDDEESYDSKKLYSFTWVLNRCNSYKFQIFDSFGDGLISSGYATLIVDGGRGNETVGSIEGNFGNETSIDIYICDPFIPLTSSPSQSMQPSQSPSISLRPSVSASPAAKSVNGEQACEGHGFDEVQCLNIGKFKDCCDWEYGCWSAIGQSDCEM